MELLEDMVVAPVCRVAENDADRSGSEECTKRAAGGIKMRIQTRGGDKGSIPADKSAAMKKKADTAVVCSVRKEGAVRGAGEMATTTYAYSFSKRR